MFPNIVILLTLICKADTPPKSGIESFSSRETPEGRQMTAKASASMNDE